MGFFKRTYTEQEVVAGCANNQRFFQEKLYRQFFPTMLHMCMRYTQDEDKAMQIVNNGFLRVFKKIDTFQFKGSLEGWIRKLVYHAMADYFKANQKSMHFLVFEERDQTIKEEATSSMYFEDLMGLVRKLPPATQQVFNLYAIEGYRHPEIAKELDISVGTSKWHLAEARKKLKKLIEQNSKQLRLMDSN